MLPKPLCTPRRRLFRDTSKLADKSTSQDIRTRLKQAILVTVEANGALTTRQIADLLDCYPSDLTSVVLEMRSTGQLIDTGSRVDPGTGHRAHYLTIRRPAA